MVSEAEKGTGLKGMQKTRPSLMHEVGKKKKKKISLEKNINISGLYNYLLEQYLGAQGHI